MKKLVPFIIIAVLLLGIAFLYVVMHIKKPEVVEEEEATVGDYFPIRENMRYIYLSTDGSDSFEVTIDYTGENILQQRIKRSSGTTVSVIKAAGGRITRIISKKEDLFRENLLGYSGEGDVLLMEPLIERAGWTITGYGTSIITDIDAAVDTPVGTFEAIEVTTESGGTKTTDYYAKGEGLVKSVVTSGGRTNTYLLSEVQGNYYLPLNISFYYPDFEEMEIRKKTGEVKFRTNDSTEKIMTGSYREYTENLVFSKKSEINSISLNGKKIIQVDLNRKFIDDTKLKSIREGMVLQSIVNTFGNFFGYEQVRITIDGKEYRSNHISLNNRPLAVNFISYPLFYDVVVYGGTASGVMSAVAASREGAEVALIEPSGHIGGMVTGGLSYTDRGNISVIGGITKEFFQLMGKHYGEPVSWDYEPHAAEEVLNSMADKENIDLYLEMQLKEENGVQKDGARITHITLDNEDLFYGQIFIDSSYEGDLMAMSDVSYTVGREGKHEYGESFAGKLPPMGNHDFFYNLTAYDDEGNLFKEISLESPGTLGQGDNKVQSYTYRLCLTDNVDNMIPFTKPDHYDSERYELLAAWIKRYEEYEGKKLDVRDVIFLGPLPNGKYDMNNNGPFSSDYVGGSWEYPDGDYDKREAIKKAHKEYIQGLLYFLSTDELVPPELRSEMKLWGYTADEFKDNGYWPYQLYIREARRMMGDYVMTQDDLQEYRTKGDSIGMGSYNIDSHNVHRYFTLDGYVQNEGDIQVAVSPYEIPYRVLVPKKSEAENLLVTVCVSASHVAYSSMRMEPQYMIMGEAAGIAAWISIDKDQSVQDIDVDSLRDKLKNNKGILELGD